MPSTFLVSSLTDSEINQIDQSVCFFQTDPLIWTGDIRLVRPSLINKRFPMIGEDVDA